MIKCVKCNVDPVMLIQSRFSKKMWQSILPLGLVMFVNAMSLAFVLPELGLMFLRTQTTIIPPTTPEFLRHLYYSLSLSISGITMIIGAPIFGSLSDRFGRKSILIISLIGIAFSCIVSAIGIIVSSVVILIAGRALVGLLDGSESIAQAAVADISERKEKATNMSMITLSQVLGFTIGPGIGGLLSDNKLCSWFGYETPFIAAAIIIVLSSIWFAFKFHDVFAKKLDSAKKLIANNDRIKGRVYTKVTLLLLFVLFCSQFAWGSYFQTVSIELVTTYHYRAAMIGIYMTLISLGFLITLLLVIRIILKYLSRSTVVLIAFIIQLITGVILAFLSSQKVIFWLSTLFASFGAGLSYNISLSLLSDAADELDQGQIMGVAMAILAISWVISVLFASMLSNIYIFIPYITMAIISIVGIATMLVYTRQRDLC